VSADFEREAPSSLRLTPETLEELLRNARSEYPNEACGVLGGSGGRVERVYALPNAARSQVRYEADPARLLDALLDIERRGWEPTPLGIYHSHPRSEAQPSPTDVREATYPDSIYVIVSLQDFDAPDVRAFRILDGQVSEVELIVEDR
jgi:[CysO sulfur-carrier protein]-S-L-cysteine hydrolase